MTTMTDASSAAQSSRQCPRLFLLALCLTSLPAFAQEAGRAEDAEVPGPKDKEAAQVMPPSDEETPPPAAGEEGNLKLNDGNYGGVAPGAKNLPPRAPHLPLKKGPQRLTWSGFQVKDGVPTVFLETTGTPNYSVDSRADGLVVTLRNTVVPVKNNRRPLHVEAFNTPIKTVETSTHGKETRVVIHTSQAVPHKERVEPAAGGFQLLLIELGSQK
jgi:hypothetical protein